MAARRYWYVLAVFGALIALSLPLYRTAGGSCTGGPGCAVGVRSPGGILGAYTLDRPGWLQVYWAAALLLGLVAVARRYRKAGALGRVVPCLLAALLASAGTVWLTVHDWKGFRSPSAVAETAHLMVFNGATPLVVATVALLALGAGERSMPLLAFAIVFGGVAYVAATYDSLYVLGKLGLPVNVSSDPSGIRQLLNLAIPAVLLLLAGAVAKVRGRVVTAARHRRVQ